MNLNETLMFAATSGIIDVATIQTKVEEMARRKYLAEHKYRIWQGNKGYYYTYLDKVDGSRKLVKKKNLQDLEESIIEFYKEGCKNPTFKECYDAWAKEKLHFGEIQKQTYDRYTNDYKRFFTEFGVKKIKDIDEDTLYDFILDSIHEMNLTAKAWSGMRTIILGTFKYAKRKHYTNMSISVFMGDIDISKRAFKKRRFTDEESVFTSDEVKMIKNAIAEESRTMLNLGVLLAFDTGLRCGQFSALRYTDLEGNVLTINKTEIHYRGEDNNYVYEIRDSTKGKFDERKVVLLPRTVELIEEIHRLNPDGEFLFEKNGKRMRGKVFTEKIIRLCGKVGIKPRSLHKCRKTYVSTLADAGVSEKIICGQVGHADFTTTRNHYWFNRSSVNEISELLSIAME